MPKLKASDIRKMSSKEREDRLKELKLEIIRLRGVLRGGGTIENPARIRELKKAVARLLTVTNEEQRTPK